MPTLAQGNIELLKSILPGRILKGSPTEPVPGIPLHKGVLLELIDRGILNKVVKSKPKSVVPVPPKPKPQKTEDATEWLANLLDGKL